jgi:hypothetical protein
MLLAVVEEQEWSCLSRGTNSDEAILAGVQDWCIPMALQNEVVWNFGVWCLV